jgi:hypothetical protein
MFGPCLDHVWAMCGPYSGHVWTMFGPCLGHVWAMFEQCFCDVSIMCGPGVDLYALISWPVRAIVLNSTCTIIFNGFLMELDRNIFED